MTPSTDETCYEFDIGEEDSSCKVNLPPLAPGQVYDLRGVHVLHTTAAGKQEEIPHVDSVAACTAAHGGWYAEGTTIVACPCSCESFASGSVTVAIEC